jgi:hypothetical protein
MKCSGGYYVIPQHPNNLLFSGHSIKKDEEENLFSEYY